MYFKLIMAASISLISFDVAAKTEKAAETRCGDYISKTININEFNNMEDIFLKLTPKGEFETTENFKKRRIEEIKIIPKTIILEKNPEDVKYFKYDADSKKLHIVSFAFDNKNMDFWSAFYSSGLQDSIKASTSKNVSVVISTSDVIDGSYEASNAYGKKVEVAKINRKTRAIFDRSGELYNRGLFPSAEKSPYEVGVISLSPEDAQRLKPLLKVAFVVDPKEPYFVTGFQKAGKTTLDFPFDINENFSIIIGDIKCGLLLDDSKKVIGSYPTR